MHLRKFSSQGVLIGGSAALDLLNQSLLSDGFSLGECYPVLCVPRYLLSEAFRFVRASGFVLPPREVRAQSLEQPNQQADQCEGAQPKDIREHTQPSVMQAEICSGDSNPQSIILTPQP